MFEERIRKLLSDLGITQAELSQRLGLHPSTVAQMLSRKDSPPHPHVCLMLAGMTEDSADRDFWINATSLTPVQLAHIASALGLPGVAPDGKTLRGVAELLAAPLNGMERQLVRLIKQVVADRETGETRP